MLSNPSNNQFQDQAIHLDTDQLNHSLSDFWPGMELDWLLLTELNANEIPCKKTIEVEE